MCIYIYIYIYVYVYALSRRAGRPAAKPGSRGLPLLRGSRLSIINDYSTLTIMQHYYICNINY